MNFRTIRPINVHCNCLPNVATNRHLAVGQYLRLYIVPTVQTDRLVQLSPHGKSRNKLSRYRVQVTRTTLIEKPHRYCWLRFSEIKISITSTDTTHKDETILQDNSLKTTTGRCRSLPVSLLVRFNSEARPYTE